MTFITLLLWIWMPRAAPPTPLQTVEFARDVRPIFEKHCQPCHFTGGKMYDKLPFDRSETIVRLGTKLFSRIKDEQQRAVIRQFLAQQK